MNRFFYQKLELHHPELLERILNHKEIGFGEMILYLKDGRVFVFNGINNTLRKIPDNMEDMTDEEFKAEFGLRLRRAMQFNGINQEELSDRIGLHQSAISRYINGNSLPNVRMIRKFCKAIGCSLDELVYEY